jgi:hypothetical protein
VKNTLRSEISTKMNTSTNIMIPIFKCPAGVEGFTGRCMKSLLATAQHEFIFPEGCSPDHWPIDEIKTANEHLLSTLRNQANIYAIFLRERDKKSPWQVVYVGERKSSGLRERITEHLIAKDRRTGSKLDEIKKAVASNHEVGLSFIMVTPEALRLSVEETIIAKNKERLPWNTHG